MQDNGIDGITWSINIDTSWILQLLLVLFGSLIFSLSISFNYFFFGGLTSITTAFQGFINLTDSNLSWKASYVFGILATSNAAWNFFGFKSRLFLEPSNYTYGLSNFGFMLAGFLNGFGWSMFRSTSKGHTILEASRHPKQSLIYFIVALAFAIGTINTRYYTGFLFSSNPNTSVDVSYEIITVNLFLILTIILLITTLVMNSSATSAFRSFLSFLLGCGHCIGLLISQASNRLLQLQALTMNLFWDPLPLIFVGTSFSLLFVFSKFLFTRRKEPFWSKEFDEETTQLRAADLESHETNTRCFGINNNGVLWRYTGLAMSGVSFGLSGLTSQTALIGMGLYTGTIALSYLPCVFVGMKAWEKTHKFFRKRNIYT